MELLLTFKNIHVLTGRNVYCRLFPPVWNVLQSSLFDLRATLHLQGADVVNATLHDVLAGWGKFQTLPLEVLLVINCDLERTQMHTCSMHMPHAHTDVCTDTHVIDIIRQGMKLKEKCNLLLLIVRGKTWHSPSMVPVGWDYSEPCYCVSQCWFTCSVESRENNNYVHIQRLIKTLPGSNM